MDEIAKLTMQSSSGEALDIVLGCDYQAAGPAWRLRWHARSVYEPEGNASGDQPLPAGGVKQWLAKLAAARITPLPEEVMGCDGATWTLELAQGLNRVCYTWWNDPPSGWEPLARFADRLLAAAHLDARVSEQPVGTTGGVSQATE